MRHWGENRWLMMDALAITVGLAGGLIAVLFRMLVDVVHLLFFEILLPILPGRGSAMILFPVLGGLLAGLIVFRIAPEIRGDGLPELIESLHKRGGQMKKRTGLALLFASTITIGSGGSAGRDSPISQMGAYLGSLLGQKFKLMTGDVQILVICGLVAGLAGTFNAPLGCAIFGMEVVLKRFKMVDAVPILLSAVVGAAVATSFLGQNPAFLVPEMDLTLAELWLCFILGVAFGVLSSLWVGLLYGAERFFDELPLKNELKAGLGGVVTGLAGFYLIGYGVMGVGYEGIIRILDMAVNSAEQGYVQIVIFLLILAVAKALATASTLGSGACGGYISPTMYVGAVMGAAAGLIFGAIFPVAQNHVSIYAFLGAGALFAGSAGAPLTCIVLIPEMAADYSLLPPMMLSCAASYGLAQVILKRSTIYTLKLEKKGISLEESEAVLDGVLVEKAMKHEVISVNSETPISQVRALIRVHNIRGFPVLKEGRLIGIITFDDVRKVPEDKQDDVKVCDVAIKKVITAYPDESMKQVMDRLYDNNVGRLIVVDREDPERLLGIVTKSDAIKAYELSAENV